MRKANNFQTRSMQFQSTSRWLAIEVELESRVQFQAIEDNKEHYPQAIKIH